MCRYDLARTRFTQKNWRVRSPVLNPIERQLRDRPQPNLSAVLSQETQTFDGNSPAKNPAYVKARGRTNSILMSNVESLEMGKSDSSLWWVLVITYDSGIISGI